MTTDQTHCRDLKPCPFCGGAANLIESEDVDGRFAAVGCPKCGAGSRQHYFLGDDARDQVASASNTRAQASAPEGVESLINTCVGWVGAVACNGTLSGAAQADIRETILAYASSTAKAVDSAWDEEWLALKFHETYERLAPSFGYETRKETRQFDPESANGRLMIAVCKEIIGSDCSNAKAGEVEKDAARYRWWRENIHLLSSDEGGLHGMAYSSQIPWAFIEKANIGELVDKIADVALSTRRGDGSEMWGSRETRLDVVSNDAFDS